MVMRVADRVPIVNRLLAALPRADYQRLLANLEPVTLTFGEVLLYTYALMARIAQTAACNRFHVVEVRLARWLLMTRDRVGSDHFRLTHDFLGHMLGVRREGVTEAAENLQRAGLISYSRGHILGQSALRLIHRRSMRDVVTGQFLFDLGAMAA